MTPRREKHRQSNQRLRSKVRLRFLQYVSLREGFRGEGKGTSLSSEPQMTQVKVGPIFDVEGRRGLSPYRYTDTDRLPHTRLHYRGRHRKTTPCPHHHSFDPDTPPPVGYSVTWSSYHFGSTSLSWVEGRVVCRVWKHNLYCFFNKNKGSTTRWEDQQESVRRFG